MFDLHCHMLPGIDDGPESLDVALEMARIAVADGISVTACTPHIYPGLYENDAAGITEAVATFRKALHAASIDLQLVVGADVHLDPDMVSGLKSGRIPSLHGSRYFLFEPPHHVAPPRIEDMVFSLVNAGYVPVLTHPERLSWIETHYDTFPRLVQMGCWMQLTAGSITGRFGPRAKYWSERMLDEGLVHIVATDAHRADKRPPLLGEAREAVAARLGGQAATDMVMTRPQGILKNLGPDSLPPLVQPVRAVRGQPFWQKLWRGS